MAYEWNVENLKLKKEVDSAGRFWNGIFNDCYTTSREDKIAFVDKYVDGKLSMILEAAEKFKAEEANLPKDKFGYVKTMSLVAWIKRNGYAEKFDTKYHYGEVYIFGMRRKFWNTNVKAGYDKFDDIVDEAFNQALRNLCQEEEEWWETHDEYMVTYTKLRNHPFAGNVVDYGYDSKDRIWVTNENDERKYLTVEDMNKILEAADKIKTYADNIKANFKFNWK